jgi:hypothetical protein
VLPGGSLHPSPRRRSGCVRETALSTTLIAAVRLRTLVGLSRITCQALSKARPQVRNAGTAEADRAFWSRWRPHDTAGQAKDAWSRWHQPHRVGPRRIRGASQGARKIDRRSAQNTGGQWTTSRPKNPRSRRKTSPRVRTPPTAKKRVSDRPIGRSVASPMSSKRSARADRAYGSSPAAPDAGRV